MSGKTRHVLLLNGPNLNLLGSREPDHYGHETLAAITARLQAEAAALDVSLDALQSNAEHALVDRIQQAAQDGTDGIIINPGAFTHTSIALRDALIGVDIPFIEVHLSNIHAREAFRRTNFFSDVAAGSITGLGATGYSLALQAMAQRLDAATRT